MRRELRLTGRKRFLQLQREGRGWSNRLLVLKALPNGLEGSRFGFWVGRRVGKAVVRNRVKRRIREAVRLTQVKGGWDALFIARSEAAGANYQELRAAVEDLLRRARLLATPDAEGVAEG